MSCLERLVFGKTDLTSIVLPVSVEVIWLRPLWVSCVSYISR
jgi:hypothetical protein